MSDAVSCVRIATTPLNGGVGFIVRGWLNGAMLVTGKALPQGIPGSDEHLAQVLELVKYLQRHRPKMGIYVEPFGGVS